MVGVRERLSGTLGEYDRMFDGFFHWLAGQYDSESGGFYYAVSSRQLENPSPDIESTVQALHILNRCGLLSRLSPTIKQAVTSFIRSKHHPSNGCFYDENPNMRQDDVMVSRAISYCMSALQLLGAKPLYQLPSSLHTIPSYLRSPAAYRDWLESIDLSNSWRGCDRMSASAAFLRQMPEEERSLYLREAFRYFESIQDRKTGLWGEGSGYVRISGTFKLYTFYSLFNVPLPRESRIYDSLLRILQEEAATDMCYVRNPIHLLSYLKINMPDEELLQVTRITLNNVKRFRKSDGGFSREIDHSPPAPNVAQVKAGESYPEMPKPVRIGQGLREGDMNAGTQAVLIRSLCYRLANVPVPMLYTKYDFLSGEEKA